MRRILNHHHISKLFVFFLIILCLSSCFLANQYQIKKNKAHYYLHETPPGGVKLKDSYFYDKAEVSNLDWLEYLYWTRRVFGADSIYKSLIPDSTVWAEKYPCLQILQKETVIHKKDTVAYYYYFPETYFRHPMYRDYPVVGITQEQAEKYSKWRSDRVFEYTLIKYGVIKMNPDQNSNDYFSIENYFSGKYKNYKPDSTFRYYPEYRLPSQDEWKQALNYSDSVKNSDCAKKSVRKQHDCISERRTMQSDINPCEGAFFTKSPTVPVLSYFGPIYNLQGNVCEWTSEDGVTTGGSWADSKERILANDTFHLETKNANTGFRNTCVWKEWKN